MNNKIVVIVVAAIIFIAGVAIVVGQQGTLNDTKDEVTVIQTDGTEKTVPYEPKRIVCLSTYACEMLMIFGYTEYVVGVTNSSYTNVDQSEYYGEGKSTDVGNFNAPSIDKIIELEPDLVITWSTQTSVAESLANAGLTYIFLQCSSIDTITTEATSLGQIIGKEDMAEKYCNYFNNIVDNIDSLVKEKTDKPSVYLESFSSYSAAGTSSSYYTMVQRAGADMIYTGTSSATVSAEWIVDQQPDIIIKTPMLSKMINGGAESIYNEIINRPGFDTIPAVQNDDVAILCSQLFGGPRCFAGMIACYNIMYPGELSYTLNDILEDYNITFGLSLSIGSLSYPEST